MNNKEQPPTQVVITQEKLVDLLLHAATREDIAKYAAENKANIAELRQEMKSDTLRLETRVSGVEASLRQEIKSSIASLKHTILGVGVALAGVMIGLANFLTHYVSH